MKISRLLALGTVGISLLAQAAFAQNIQTNTTSTTVGSTQFGFDITAAQLGTVMQASVAPTCDVRGTSAPGTMVCTSNGPTAAANDNYVKAVGMPGSFTGNPFKVVWTTADMGCGFPCLAGNGSLAANGGNNPQTAPDFDGTRTLTGPLTSTVDLGLGTVATDELHGAGHITFTLNPATGAATIDQQVVQNINAPGGLQIAFTGTDATAVGASFIAASNDAVFNSPGVNLQSRVQLTQTGEFGPPSPTPFQLDVSTSFTYAGPTWLTAIGLTGSEMPNQNVFSTPGLNISVGNPDQFPTWN